MLLELVLVGAAGDSVTGCSRFPRLDEDDDEEFDFLLLAVCSRLLDTPGVTSDFMLAFFLVDLPRLRVESSEMAICCLFVWRDRLSKARKKILASAIAQSVPCLT